MKKMEQQSCHVAAKCNIIDATSSARTANAEAMILSAESQRVHERTLEEQNVELV